MNLGFSEKMARKAYDKFDDVDRAADWLYQQDIFSGNYDEKENEQFSDDMVDDMIDCGN